MKNYVTATINAFIILNENPRVTNNSSDYLAFMTAHYYEIVGELICVLIGELVYARFIVSLGL